MKIAIVQIEQNEIPELASDFFGKNFCELIGGLNTKRFLEALNILKMENIDLIIFPELYPYGWSDYKENSWLVELAKRFSIKTNTYLIIGEVYFEEDNKPRNSSTLIYSNGKISRYFKQNLMFEEYKWGFQSGKPIVDIIHNIKVGRLICSDVNSNLIKDYVELKADFVIYQSMAVKWFLKGDNKEKLNSILKNNSEANEYYKKAFPENRRTSWDDLLKRDSKLLPLIFVNTAKSIKWGGVNELGGGYSGVYYKGKRIVGIDNEEPEILIIDVNFKPKFKINDSKVIEL